MKLRKQNLNTIVLVSMLCTSINLFGGLGAYVQWGSEVLRRTAYVVSSWYPFTINHTPDRARIERDILRELEDNNTEYLEELLTIPGINLDAIDIGSETNKKMTIVMYAINVYAVEAIRLFLAHPSININRRDTYRDTALHYAIAHAHYRSRSEIIRMLLAVPGIEVNTYDNSGSTPLIMAALMGKIGIVQMLLARTDIDVNQPISCDTNVYDGYTPLMRVCVKGSPYDHKDDIEEDRLVIFRTLLQHPRIQVNAVNDQGCTVLMIVSAQNDAERVQALLEHEQIDVDIVNKNGCTALDIAQDYGWTKVVALLKAYAEAHDIMVKPACS